jgi:hypothetical protein
MFLSQVQIVGGDEFEGALTGVVGERLFGFFIVRQGPQTPHHSGRGTSPDYLLVTLLAHRSFAAADRGFSNRSFADGRMTSSEISE